MNYWDNFIVIAPDFDSCQAIQMELISLLESLGFFVRWKKCTSPSTFCRYLGIDIDSSTMQLSLPRDKGVWSIFWSIPGLGCRTWWLESGGNGGGQRTNCRSIGADCVQWREGTQMHGMSETGITLGMRMVLWNFIVTKIGEDEVILGNDFAMAHQLTVRAVGPKERDG